MKVIPLGIKNFPLGKVQVGFCIIRKKEIRYKQDGAPYLFLELGDKSGRLNARIWKKPLKIAEGINAGLLVKIQAITQVYQNKKELKIEKIRPTVPDDNIRLVDILPTSDKTMEEHEKQFNTHLEKLKTPHFRCLIENLLSKDEFKTAYFLAPAGKLWHHNYLSGMVEHVLSMLDMTEVLVSNYPNIQTDLLKTAIICHDIGKVYDYATNGFIEFSDEGRLIGHVANSFWWVKTEMANIENFPETLQKQLLHLVLSHQGAVENGSPISPKTLEAVILQHLTVLDANTNALCRITQNDVLPGEDWSKYIPLLNRFIYHPEKPSNNH